MNGWIKLSTELPDEECVQDAMADPWTRQVVSLFSSAISLAKKCGRRGRLEHEGGPVSLERIAARAGIVVPAELVSLGHVPGHARDASGSDAVTVRDVADRCLATLLRWGWVLRADDGVLVIRSWEKWYGAADDKLDEIRRKERERKARRRDAKRRAGDASEGGAGPDVSRGTARDGTPDPSRERKSQRQRTTGTTPPLTPPPGGWEKELVGDGSRDRAALEQPRPSSQSAVQPSSAPTTGGAAAAPERAPGEPKEPTRKAMLAAATARVLAAQQSMRLLTRVRSSSQSSSQSVSRDTSRDRVPATDRGAAQGTRRRSEAAGAGPAAVELPEWLAGELLADWQRWVAVRATLPAWGAPALQAALQQVAELRDRNGEGWIRQRLVQAAAAGWRQLAEPAGVPRAAAAQPAAARRAPVEPDPTPHTAAALRVAREAHNAAGAAEGYLDPVGASERPDVAEAAKAAEYSAERARLAAAEAAAARAAGEHRAVEAEAAAARARQVAEAALAAVAARAGAGAAAAAAAA